MCGFLFITVISSVLQQCFFHSICHYFAKKWKLFSLQRKSVKFLQQATVMLNNLHRRSVVRHIHRVRVTPVTFSFRLQMAVSTWSSVNFTTAGHGFQPSPLPLPCFRLPTCPLSAQSLSVFGLYPCSGIRNVQLTPTHTHTPQGLSVCYTRITAARAANLCLIII